MRLGDFRETQSSSLKNSIRFGHERCSRVTQHARLFINFWMVIVRIKRIFDICKVRIIRSYVCHYRCAIKEIRYQQKIGCYRIH